MGLLLYYVEYAFETLKYFYYFFQTNAAKGNYDSGGTFIRDLEFFVRACKMTATVS